MGRFYGIISLCLEVAQKKEKEKEGSPAKLLDDLFRKTKATPCIYWLPLSDAEVLIIFHLFHMSGISLLLYDYVIVVSFLFLLRSWNAKTNNKKTMKKPAINEVKKQWIEIVDVNPHRDVNLHLDVNLHQDVHLHLDVNLHQDVRLHLDVGHKLMKGVDQQETGDEKKLMLNMWFLTCVHCSISHHCHVSFVVVHPQVPVSSLTSVNALIELTLHRHISIGFLCSAL